MKPAHLLGIGALALTALAFAPLASAKNAYRLQAQQQLKLVDKDGKGEIGCIYCHTSPSGGRNWNKFGQELHDSYFGDAKRNFAEALYMVLKANKDADGDKYPDVLEVVAKTLPGDAASKPTKTVAALEAELKAMGGVDAFKAK